MPFMDSAIQCGSSNLLGLARMNLGTRYIPCMHGGYLHHRHIMLLIAFPGLLLSANEIICSLAVGCNHFISVIHVFNTWKALLTIPLDYWASLTNASVLVNLKRIITLLLG